MPNARLEHVNVTVTDPDKTAASLERLYGWKVRWKGQSRTEGYSVHVGTKDQYIALYAEPKQSNPTSEPYYVTGGLNHIAVVVDDLDSTAKAVVAEGFEPYSFQEYDPGRRFYYYDNDNIEFEVVCYDD